MSGLSTTLLIALGALIVLALVARLVWGGELRLLEERLFDYLGVPPVIRYVLIAGLIGLSWYYTWVSERAEAASSGRPLVRRLVIWASLGALAIAALILIVGL
jgi:hypothetical protein